MLFCFQLCAWNFYCLCGISCRLIQTQPVLPVFAQRARIKAIHQFDRPDAQYACIAQTLTVFVKG